MARVAIPYTRVHCRIARYRGMRARELCDLQWTQIDFHRGTIRCIGARMARPRCTTSMERSFEHCGSCVVRMKRADTCSCRNAGTWSRRPGCARCLRASVFSLECRFRSTRTLLRHACGFKFANQGKDTMALQGYLGHRNIQSTTICTELSPDRFKGWEAE
jgi:site-specific recombinase XerD